MPSRHTRLQPENPQMPAAREIPWTRLTAEGIAIVVSILLAFSIEAWWAERVERRAQSVELDRLHDELSEIRRQLDMESRERSNTAAVQLLEMVEEHVDRDAPLEVPDSILGDLIFYGNFDVATPVLDGTILSGRLDEFDSERFISAVFAWRLAIQEVLEEDDRLREVMVAQLIPALMTRGNMASALLRKRSVPSRTIELKVDDELEGHLALRIRMTRVFDRRLDSLGPVLDELLGAIEQALES